MSTAYEKYIAQMRAQFPNWDGTKEHLAQLVKALHRAQDKNPAPPEPKVEPKITYIAAVVKIIKRHGVSFHPFYPVVYRSLDKIGADCISYIVMPDGHGHKAALSFAKLMTESLIQAYNESSDDWVCIVYRNDQKFAGLATKSHEFQFDKTDVVSYMCLPGNSTTADDARAFMLEMYQSEAMANQQYACVLGYGHQNQLTSIIYRSDRLKMDCNQFAHIVALLIVDMSYSDARVFADELKSQHEVSSREIGGECFVVDNTLIVENTRSIPNGSIVRHYDNDGHGHLGFVFNVSEKDCSLVFLSSNPYWSPRFTKLTPSRHKLIEGLIFGRNLDSRKETYICKVDRKIQLDDLTVLVPSNMVPSELVEYVQNEMFCG